MLKGDFRSVDNQGYSEVLSESKNVHMEHLEDEIFNKGVNGARESINSLRNLRDMLAGHGKSKVNATVKRDGAPALFAGVDPEDGRFFVAKKGLFNVNPQMFKTPAEIKKTLSGDLQKKFLIALSEFSKLGIKKGIVYQGDLMFTKGDIKVETIEDQKYFTFHPNTIVYAVPVKSKLGAMISKARIGIVWHTVYTGKSITTMQGSFGKDITKKMKSNPGIWMDDATYRDVTGNATFTASETAEITSILSEAGKIFRTIDASLINTIAENDDLKSLVKTHNNTYVRAGIPFPDVHSHVKGLHEFITNWYQKKIDAVKTPDAKARWEDNKKDILKRVLSNPKALMNIYSLMNKIVEAKQIIIEKMNKANSINVFLKTRNGWKVTSQEGFVAIDKLSGNAIKIVDRLEFSRANFSDDILKGWEK